MSANTRLSVPPPRTKLPRALTPDERDALVAIADVLLGPSERAEPPSRCPDYVDKLEVALATRSDSFDAILDTAAAGVAAEDLNAWLRDLHDSDAERFQVISTVLGGAYLMVPAVRDAIGYAGQRAEIPRLEEAVDQIMDGILDPVIERGHFYVEPPAEG